MYLPLDILACFQRDWGRGRIAVSACLLLLVSGCGSGDDSSTQCSPSPQITSTPPTSATVGQQYVYTVMAPHECGLLPSTCYDFDALKLPPGAAVDLIAKAIIWTPAAGQANTSVPFEIATVPDYCGNRVTQSWSVFVSP